MNSKNINSKKWIKISIFTTLFGFTLLALFNYAVDPFYIFNSKILKHNVQINERFLKIEFLEKNHKNFNSYMIGSSRIGVTSPKVVEQYIPNSKFYNMSMSSATMYDYKMHIRYLIKQKYRIDTIYLQLDVDTMHYYGLSDSDYLSKLHPYVEGKSLTFYYFEYLSGFFPFNAKVKIAQNINYKPTKTTYSLETGVWTNPPAEKRVEENCKEYVASEEKFHRKNRPSLTYITKDKTISDLKEIVLLCKTNNIKLYTFITPHNNIMMDSFVREDYLDYLSDIAHITNFYDFSGYNSVTENNCNYYETSHYRPKIGKLIAGRIFHDNNIDIPDDFGILVTKETIKDHLIKRKEQILKRDNYEKN